MRKSIFTSTLPRQHIYNNMHSRLKKVLLFTVVILLVIFLFQKISWLPSLSNPFKSKPVMIDETPVLIKQINDLAQLVTILLYDEVVMDSSRPKNLPSFPGLRPVPDKIVLIAKGKVLAGVDLKTMDEDNFFISEDSISILLPPAQIFSAMVNPSDFEIFDEEGTWRDDAVTLLKIKARKKIISRALKAGILAKASRKAKAVMENFLQSTGRFKKVTVRSGGL